MGAPYDNIPGVDSGNSFPPALRQAMALYPELVAAFAAKTHTHSFSQITLTELDQQDLNTILTQGLYIQSQNADASVAPNYPTTLAGFLEVVVNGNFAWQEYTTYNSPTRRFFRAYYINAWSAWQEVQPLIPAGTTAQYYRGDKTWQTLNKNAVGLSNVDNTSDATKLADYIPKWKTGVAYTVGQQVITPNNSIMDCKTAHTSGTFATDVLTKWDAGELAVPYGHAGKNSGFQGGLSGLTTVQLDIAEGLKGGVSFDNANDWLTVTIPGYYVAMSQCYFSGSVAGGDIAILQKIRASDSSTKQLCRASVPPITQDTAVNMVKVEWFDIGDHLRLAAQTGGQSVWGSDGTNGCWIELAWFSAT